MNNSYYTMDDLKAETSAPPSSIAHDEPRDSDVAQSYGEQLAALLAERNVDGVAIETSKGTLIVSLADDVSASDAAAAMEAVDNNGGDGVLNVVDKLTEDVEAAVLQCATGDLSAAVIERVLKIGEDTEDDIRVVFTASRRART